MIGHFAITCLAGQGAAAHSWFLIKTPTAEMLGMYLHHLFEVKHLTSRGHVGPPGTGHFHAIVGSGAQDRQGPFAEAGRPTEWTGGKLGRRDDDVMILHYSTEWVGVCRLQDPPLV